MSILGLVGGSIVSGLFGASSSKKAASASADAAKYAADAQIQSAQLSVDESRRQFDLGRDDLAPYREAGGNALAQMQGALGGSFKESEGYRFQRSEMEKALERQQAARGTSLGGAAAKELARYTSGLASQEYGADYNRRAALAGVGQTATNAGINLGQSTASNVGNALMASGNAQASGYLNAGNAQAQGYMGQNQAFQGTMGNLFSVYAMNQAGAFPNSGGGFGSLFGGGS